MKITLLLLLGCLVYFQSDCQLMMAEKGKNTAIFRELLKSEVGIYLTDDEEVNDEISESFRNYWDITPVKVLYTKSDLEKYFGEGHKFIITIVTVKSTDNEDYSYFVLMNRSNKSSISLDDFICYVPIDRYYEFKFENMMRRFDYMVSSLNDALHMTEDGIIPDIKKTNTEPCMTAMSRNAADLKELTLLIPSEIFNIGIIDFKQMKSPLNKPLFDKDAFEGYPYKYKIMPYEEIENLQEPGKYCLLIPAGHPLSVYLTVYDMETKKVLLMTQDSKIVTSQIKASHIKKIIETINGE